MQVICSFKNKPGFNLATEEFLFSRRQDDVLFLYINDPCVVIGCNQAIRVECNLLYCGLHRIEVLRRMSGGGAVYHDRGNLNYCFVKNRESGKFPIGSDSLKPVVQVLSEMGLPVLTGKRKDLWLPGGFKISGTASHIGQRRSLFHGTLLYDANLEQLEKSITPETPVTALQHEHAGASFQDQNQPTLDEPVAAIASVKSPVKNIKTFLEENGKKTLPSPDYFKLIKDHFLTLYGQTEPLRFTKEEVDLIEELRVNTYQKFSWIFKK